MFEVQVPESNVVQKIPATTYYNDPSRRGECVLNCHCWTRDAEKKTQDGFPASDCRTLARKYATPQGTLSLILRTWVEGKDLEEQKDLRDEWANRKVARLRIYELNDQ